MIKPTLLPVWNNRQQILDALYKNNVIIVESPTGSGKTTQIPLILKEAGFRGVIGITQPRRIATLSVCEFINKQLSDEDIAPSYCAYKMRFYDTTTPETKIKILTDGMLLQEMKTDPLISNYSVIMVDEAHERSLNIDFILGLLKQILKKRDDLKLIISSATINTSVFANFFKDSKNSKAPIITISGKVYNVDIRYLKSGHEYNDSLVTGKICNLIDEITERFIKSEKKLNLDTLVFLPGEYEIKSVINEVCSTCKNVSLLQIYPLYGRLNKEEQELVFTPTEPGKIKIVFSTNIAETSLTINGISVVIDSGFAKFNSYNQTDYTSALLTQPISKASAMQRAGRAGRTSDGICFRLYSESSFKSRDMFTTEEILRTDLSEVVLRMCDLGIYDFENFPFITQPGKKALKSGEKTLLLLSAIDKDRHLTKIGQMMVKYPLLPRHARALVESIIRNPDAVFPTIISISFLSCKTPFVFPPGLEDLARAVRKNYSSEYGDFIDCIRLFFEYSKLTTTKKKENFCNLNFLDKQSMDEITHVVYQLCDITRELGIPVQTENYKLSEDIYKDCIISMASGLRQFICSKDEFNNAYHSLTAQEIHIHPGSAWFKTQPQYIVAGEIIYTTRLYARTVSPIRPEWLNEISGEIPGNLVNSKKTGKKKNTAATPIKDEIKISKKSVSIGNVRYRCLTGKRGRRIIVIPYQNIQQIADIMSRRKNKSEYRATILLNKGYLLFDEKLSNIIKILPYLDFTDEGMYSEPVPKGVFYHTDQNVIAEHLDDILKITKINKNRFGFLNLVSLKNGYSFCVEQSFDKAVSDVAFSLLNLYDETGNKKFIKLYDKIVKYVD